ncbi:hypothetical protein Droror1_Dr00027021 [Drosera rotundifolia]
MAIRKGSNDVATSLAVEIFVRLHSQLLLSLSDSCASRARELEEMFPIIDPQAKPTTKPSIFVSLLWKQLNHLGNAGFDPALFRVDPYGNVLYYHADLASPLAWDIDH